MVDPLKDFEMFAKKTFNGTSNGRTYECKSVVDHMFDGKFDRMCGRSQG